MKTLLKIIIGLLAVIGVAIGLVFYFTSGMTGAADEFFAAVKAKDYAKAYQYCSEDFRASTPQEDLVAFLAKNALLAIQKTSWSNRSISGSRGGLDGSVTTESGGIIPIRLSFVKEHNSWLIYAIYKSTSGIASDESAGQQPSQPDQLALVQESIRNFALAVNASDFTVFHKHVSRLWQQQITVEKFNAIFKPFIDAQIDLLPLESYTPVIDRATVSEEGVLSLEGHYPTKPYTAMFELAYIYEGVRWKLVKTNINVKQAE